MGYYIDAIYLEKNEQYSIKHSITLDEQQLEQFNCLDNLSKINIFLGSNNSGKSNLMRTILKNKELHFIARGLSLLELNQLRDDLLSEIDIAMNRIRAEDYAEIKNLLNITQKEFIKENEDFLLQYSKLINKLEVLNGSQHYRGSIQYISGIPYEEINNSFNSIGIKYKNKLSKILNELPNIYSFRRLYIPTLRGLRALNNSGSHNLDVYKQRTLNDYFDQEDSDLIFTGLDLYQELQNLLLGSLSDREKVVEYQKFLGDTFFDGEPVTLIPSIGSDVVTVKIGNEREMKIYELGDGIQSIIIQTFPLFANMGSKMLIFIEEPELYLHPGLQRKLLETFMRDEFSDFQFFLTTHSNHLLDVTLDLEQISIYSFKKTLEENESKERKGMFTVENVSNEENDLLDLLGVQNSSVYLSNCTIWVEGITDRYYIRKYIELYQNFLNLAEKDRFREDYHYSFVEYSGNNITHWSFLDNENSEEYKNINVERVCSKLFLIADKDSKKKLLRQEQLSEKLGERFYCLDCKEIENLISEDVLNQVIADYEGKEVEELQFDQKITRKGYRDKYLGKFIDDHLTDRKRKTYASTSGTVTDKVGFCKKAIKYTNNYADLSDDSKDLIERIYEFISSMNKNRF